MMATLRLTANQRKTIEAAQRARKDPKPSWMWTEGRVLAAAKPATLTALERMGLIESYLVDRVSSLSPKTMTHYRLTAAGVEYNATN